MTGGPPDFAALGLLDGLEEPARSSRAALLASLHADGVALEELQAAVAEGRLALLPAELALGGAGRRTAREVAAEVGVDLAALEAVRRAAGLPLPPPDAPALGELDLFGARALAAFLDGGMPLDGLVEASRVFGEAAAHAAAAAGTLANTVLPQPGDTEGAYAARLETAMRELTPYAAELLGVMYLLHNRENLRNEVVAQEELAAGRRSDVHDVSVGFCDVVGFTRLGEGVPAADLGAIATRLAALAAEVDGPAGAAREDDRGRGDARRAAAGAAAGDDARADGGRRGRGRPVPAAARAAPPTGRRCGAGATTTAARSTSRRG